MQTVYRQDGSAVELSDAEAEQWIKRGLATAPPVVTEAPAKPATGCGKKSAPATTTIEGELA